MNLAKVACGVCALSLVAVTSQATAQDEIVSQRLTENEIPFEIDEDKDFKIVYNYESEGRSQLVFISGGTETINEITVREVFAPAAIIEKDGVDGAKALELLEDSSSNKIGSWEIRDGVLYFVIKVFEELSAYELEFVLDAAADTADTMELKLTDGGDDL